MTIFLSHLIKICYFSLGKAKELESFEGYPRFYQKMIIKKAGKQAGQLQRQIILQAGRL